MKKLKNLFKKKKNNSETSSIASTSSKNKQVDIETELDGESWEIFVTNRDYDYSIESSAYSKDEDYQIDQDLNLGQRDNLITQKWLDKNYPKYQRKTITNL